MLFFWTREKGNFGGFPAELVTDPSKSNLHEIIEAKNVIVMDGETLKDCLIKSICKMFDTGLKVNKSHIYFSL